MWSYFLCKQILLSLFKVRRKKTIWKKNHIAKKSISLYLRIARASEVGNYMPLTWLLTVALNESCTSRGGSHYMITARILLGKYKILLLWVLLMNSYSLENCKYAWEESVPVTNGSIKGEEKLQDFTDLLKFQVLCIKIFVSFLRDAVFIIAHDSTSFGMNSTSYQQNCLYTKFVRLAKAQECNWSLKR